MALPQLAAIDHQFSAAQQASALPTVDDINSGTSNDGTSSGGLAHDGTVFDFSDAGDAAEVTTSTNTPTGAFTYMCRVARRAGTTWPPTARIFFSSPGSSVNLPGLYYDPAQGASGVIRALIDNAGWNTSYDIESWNAAEFHIVAMTHDGLTNGTLNVYVDGTNVGSFTTDPGAVTALITWGTYNSGQSWGNDMTDMVLWRGTELTPTEIGDAGTELNALNATDQTLTAGPVTRGVRSGFSASIANQSALALAVGAVTRGTRSGFSASLASQSALEVTTGPVTRGTRSFSASLATESPKSLAAGPVTRGVRSGFSASLAAQSALTLTASAPTRGARSSFSATISKEITLTAGAVTRGARSGFTATLTKGTPLTLVAGPVTRGVRSFTATLATAAATPETTPVITSFSKVATPTVASFTKASTPTVASFSKVAPPAITTFTKV